MTLHIQYYTNISLPRHNSTICCTCKHQLQYGELILIQSNIIKHLYCLTSNDLQSHIKLIKASAHKPYLLNTVVDGLSHLAPNDQRTARDLLLTLALTDTTNSNKSLTTQRNNDMSEVQRLQLKLLSTLMSGGHMNENVPHQYNIQPHNNNATHNKNKRKSLSPTSDCDTQFMFKRRR